MFAMRVRLAVAAVAVGLLAGCGDSEPAAAPESPSVLAPRGDMVVLDPVTSLPGAAERSMEGLTFLVPAGWEVARTEADGMVTLTVADPADANQTVSLMVGGGDGSTNAAIDEDAFQAALAVDRPGISDVARHPVDWPSWPYAVAVTAVVELDAGGTLDAFSISARHPDTGELVAGVVRAPVGTLEESDGYQVLASMRPDAG